MTSQINPGTINANYPVAGQDNDTQGFRTNYSNIKTQLAIAAQEISNSQANVTILQGNTISLAQTFSNYIQSNATPTSASSVGTAGQIAYDSTHIYVCVATNTWVRASLSTF